MLQLKNQHVTINNRKIILADTPEARLKYLDWQELNRLAYSGVNAITCTVRGGDVKDITPYVNNDPAQGFDVVKLANWYAYLRYANSVGIVPFLMLSENENHFSLSDEQQKLLIDALVRYFQDLSIVWTREEFPKGHDSFITTYFSYLKAAIMTVGANHLVAIHNNTDEVNWTGHNARIDLVQLQTKLATGNASIKKAYDAGFAVFQSELVGGVSASNAKQWCGLGGDMSSGAGAYFTTNQDDVKAPHYASDGNLFYKPVYDIMVPQMGGTAPQPVSELVIGDGIDGGRLWVFTDKNDYSLQIEKQ